MKDEELQLSLFEVTETRQIVVEAYDQEDAIAQARCWDYLRDWELRDVSTSQVKGEIKEISIECKVTS